MLQLAGLCGWTLRYHTFDSRRSDPGWPDLVLFRPPAELIVVELKTDTGKVTPAQQAWLDALCACDIEAVVWRPRDFPAVTSRLARRRPGERATAADPGRSARPLTGRASITPQA